MRIRARADKRVWSQPIRRSEGISKSAAVPRTIPAQSGGACSSRVTNRVTTVTVAMLVTWSVRKAMTTPQRPQPRNCARIDGREVSGFGSIKRQLRLRRSSTVVAMLTRPIPASSNSAEELPKRPVHAVARGGPTTQAKETMARVRITRDGEAPS
jgi:hypothetical protein